MNLPIQLRLQLSQVSWLRWANTLTALVTAFTNVKEEQEMAYKSGVKRGRCS